MWNQKLWNRIKHWRNIARHHFRLIFWKDPKRTGNKSKNRQEIIKSEEKPSSEWGKITVNYLSNETFVSRKHENVNNQKKLNKKLELDQLLSKRLKKILLRVCRKFNSHIVFVEMQIITAIMEVSQKTKNTSTIWLSSPTSGYISKENKVSI